MLINAEIKRIRSLAQKKYRRQYNQFVIEGARLLEAAVVVELKFEALYLTEHFQNSPEHQPLIAKKADPDADTRKLEREIDLMVYQLVWIDL